MIREAEGFDKWVAIAGFKEVCISDVDQFLRLAKKRLCSVEVQFFDARLVAEWEHLYFASLNALNAFKSKKNLSKSLAIECLLFACAQRQIKEALAVIGVKPGLSKIAVLVVADEEEAAKEALEMVARMVGGVRDDGVLELSDEKVSAIMEVFGVSDVELEAEIADGEFRRALCNLVLEHVALLAAER